jgi:hypothetical protein
MGLGGGQNSSCWWGGTLYLFETDKICEKLAKKEANLTISNVSLKNTETSGNAYIMIFSYHIGFYVHLL